MCVLVYLGGRGTCMWKEHMCVHVHRMERSLTSEFVMTLLLISIAVFHLLVVFSLLG